MGSGGADGQQGLASSASDKQRAITYMEQNLLPDTQTAGGMGEGGGAVHPPMVAPAAPSVFGTAKPDTGLPGLSAWAVEGGLSAAMSTWRGQVSGLMGRLQRELSGLRSAKSLFLGQDTATGADVGGVTKPLFTAPMIGSHPSFDPLNPLNPLNPVNPLVTHPPNGPAPVFQPLSDNLDRK